MKRIFVSALTGFFIIAASCTQGTQQAPNSPDRGAKSPQASAPLQAAWEQKWEPTLERAKKEKTLVLYGEITPQQRNALLVFQNRYDINIEFVVGQGNEIAAKWGAEQSAGLNLVDAFHMSPGPGINFMKPKKALAPVDQYFILPEVIDPRAWPQGELPFVDASDKTMLMLNYSYTSYIAINTDLVKEGQLKGLQDLLQPEWKEKIVFYDPSIFSGATAWVVFLIKEAG